MSPVTPRVAPSFLQVQQQVGLLIRGKIIVGYALWEFLSVRAPTPYRWH